MQSAGMTSLVDFEDLPVSGFGDVVPKYFKLRQSFAKLKKALESPECLGLVAIDYPGFNMKLVKRMGTLRKPVLYVAPPQVWAWKKKRARELAKNPYVKLAVFFDFEEAVYKAAGCSVVRVRHPFCSVFTEGVRQGANQNTILIMPGSRKSQALRNLPIYLKSLQNAQDVTLVAAREELVPVFENALQQIGNRTPLPKIRMAVAPQGAKDRMLLYRSAAYAVTAPGTATLELALSGVPFSVCTKPDLLTFCLGKLFVRTKYFALPNIILGEYEFSECIVAPLKKCGCRLYAFAPRPREDVIARLWARLAVGKTLEQLALEFLREFVERKPE